jgi:hypothetical protein
MIEISCDSRYLDLELVLLVTIYNHFCLFIVNLVQPIAIIFYQ